MNVGELRTQLEGVDDDWPVMLGHRFLCDIKGVGIDIVTSPSSPTVVLESSHKGYTRLPPYRIVTPQAPEPPKPPNLKFRELGWPQFLGNFWPAVIVVVGLLGLSAYHLIRGLATVTP